jgi:hypothetical protein
MRQAALALPDPAHEMSGLEPHLTETLRLQHELRDSLEEIRHRACHEVTLIVEHAPGKMLEVASPMTPTPWTNGRLQQGPQQNGPGPRGTLERELVVDYQS